MADEKGFVLLPLQREVVEKLAALNPKAWEPDSAVRACVEAAKEALAAMTPRTIDQRLRRLEHLHEGVNPHERWHGPVE